MRKQYVPLEVVEEKCTGCGVCFRIGCPAILKSDEVDAKSGKPLAIIDRDLCTGCEICAQLCPHDAITFRDQMRLHEEGRRGGVRAADRRGGARAMTENNTVNFVLVGVGGQGTLLASNILADVGLAAGLDVKKSEVHGMSQRGGSVVSHVRWHPEQVSSPLVGLGEADVLLAFEKLEALRFAEFLKAGGTAVVNEMQIVPITVSAGTGRLPQGRATSTAPWPQWAPGRSASPASASPWRRATPRPRTSSCSAPSRGCSRCPKTCGGDASSSGCRRSSSTSTAVAFASGRACVA